MSNIQEIEIRGEAFVLRGTCHYHITDINNTEAFRLSADQIICFKFSINSKLVEYTDPEASIWFDQSEKEWVIVLDNLPFNMNEASVVLRDIWFDENLLPKEFVFTLNSFESINESAFLSVDPEEGCCDMWKVHAELLTPRKIDDDPASMDEACCSSEDVPMVDIDTIVFRNATPEEKSCCRFNLTYLTPDNAAVVNNIDVVTLLLGVNTVVKIKINHDKLISSYPNSNNTYTTQYSISAVYGIDNLAKSLWDISTTASLLSDFSNAALLKIEWRNKVEPMIICQKASIQIHGRSTILALKNACDGEGSSTEKVIAAIKEKNEQKEKASWKKATFLVYASVRSDNLLSDLKNIRGVFINLDCVHCYIHNVLVDNIDIIKDASASEMDVTFAINPVSMMSYNKNVPVNYLHFGEIVVKDFSFEDKRPGFHMTIKKIMFDGHDVKIHLDTYCRDMFDYEPPFKEKADNTISPVNMYKKEEKKPDLSPIEKLLQEGKAELNLKIYEDRSDVGQYQVRSISAAEFKDLEHLKHKERGKKVYEKIVNTQPVLTLANDTDHEPECNICSELVVQDHGKINSVIISDGGSVVVEAGGEINYAFVEAGGTLELCSGAFVHHVYEGGGAVYGANKDTCNIATASLIRGSVDKGKYCTIHLGVTMSDVIVRGGLDAMPGSATNLCTVEDGGELKLYGGFHQNVHVKKGGKLYCESACTVTRLTVDEGADIYIFKGSSIIVADLNGSVHYEGDDITKDYHLAEVAVKYPDRIDKIKASNILDQLVDDIDKE